MPEDGEHPSLEGRVAALEREIKELRDRLIRGPDVALGGLPGFSAMPAAISNAGSAPTREPVVEATPGIDLETLVGLLRRLSTP